MLFLAFTCIYDTYTVDGVKSERREEGARLGEDGRRERDRGGLKGQLVELPQYSIRNSTESKIIAISYFCYFHLAIIDSMIFKVKN